MSGHIIEFNDPNRPLQISASSLGSVEVVTWDQGAQEPAIEHVELVNTGQAIEFVRRTINFHAKYAT